MNRAMTLIEMVVALAIVGIIIAVAGLSLPATSSRHEDAIEAARDSAIMGARRHMVIAGADTIRAEADGSVWLSESLRRGR